MTENVELKLPSFTVFTKNIYFNKILISGKGTG